MYEFSALTFSQAVKDWIAGRPLRTVAEDTGVSFSTLSRLTRGQTPTVATFMTLCIAMRVNPMIFVYNPNAEPEYV